jgi:protein-export membrane protein SecD
LGYGNFNDLVKQAKDIALVLRAGALPVPLEFEEQRIVGPSLGFDSVNQAKIAGIIGCLAVFIFMIIYYGMSGWFGVIVQAFNVLFILAILVGFDATLTLPGIAGIILTVGMAVDATIIINERIRQEVRTHANNFKCFEAGFEQAFWTIIDANITTALAGFCLLNFGTGPVRGFAVTLLIGIVTTVYTGFYVGRFIYELYVHRLGNHKKLSI